VAEHDQRNTGMLGASERRHGSDVLDEPGPPRRAEHAVALRRTGGAAVATVVVGIDDVAAVDERRRQPGVAGGVLAHAVGELDDRPHRSLARPPVPDDGLPIAAGDGEVAGVHRRRTLRAAGQGSVRTPSAPAPNRALKFGGQLGTARR
jgi:hypothetical protein